MKKLLALLLAVAMLASLATLPVAAREGGTPAPRFPDAEGTWAESAIRRLGAVGLVQGDPDGSINPDRLMTRAEMATVLVRLLGLKAKAIPSTFTDVKDDDWFADAVLKCAAVGIMVGDGTGRVNPDARITREEAIAMISRALGVKGKSGSYLAGFEDADSVSTYAKGYMDALITMGLLTGVGDGTRLAPQDAIDRASVLTLLDRLVVAYVTAPGEVTVEEPNGFAVIDVPSGGTVTVTGLAAGVVVAASDTANVDLKALDVESTVVNAPVNVIVGKDTRVSVLILNAATRVEYFGAVASVTKNHNKAITVADTADQ